MPAMYHVVAHCRKYIRCKKSSAGDDPTSAKNDLGFSGSDRLFSHSCLVLLLKSIHFVYDPYSFCMLSDPDGERIRRITGMIRVLWSVWWVDKDSRHVLTAKT